MRSAQHKLRCALCRGNCGMYAESMLSVNLCPVHVNCEMYVLSMFIVECTVECTFRPCQQWNVHSVPVYSGMYAESMESVNLRPVHVNCGMYVLSMCTVECTFRPCQQWNVRSVHVNSGMYVQSMSTVECTFSPCQQWNARSVPVYSGMYVQSLLTYISQYMLTVQCTFSPC